MLPGPDATPDEILNAVQVVRGMLATGQSGEGWLAHLTVLLDPSGYDPPGPTSTRDQLTEGIVYVRRMWEHASETITTSQQEWLAHLAVVRRRISELAGVTPRTRQTATSARACQTVVVGNGEAARLVGKTIIYNETNFIYRVVGCTTGQDFVLEPMNGGPTLTPTPLLRPGYREQWMELVRRRPPQ